MVELFGYFCKKWWFVRARRIRMGESPKLVNFFDCTTNVFKISDLFLLVICRFGVSR